MRDGNRTPHPGIRREGSNDEKPKDVPTQDDLVRLLEAAEPESPAVRAINWLDFTTAMRFGELSALTRGNIDEEQASSTSGPLR